ncbi:hypothetical protein C8R48DRAFT_782569 [Suillus tomentosus]|nr:hypothetical protein C8R48DRAFT_782569 [Suillus tomentosus]
MDIPPLVLKFFNLPSDSDDIDQYLQQDLRRHQSTDSLSGSSPCLNDSDLELLDGAYWLANPARLDLLKHHISGHPSPKQIEDKSNWVADLFATPKCKQKKAPPSTGSITEPESDDPPVTHVPPRPELSESATRLDRHCMFATPSPPPPGSIYWKYFTTEEDARWYDRSGTDKSFQAVRKMKEELQALLDT